MSWKLEVYSPTGSLLSTVTEATDPNPIDGGISAIVDGKGATRQINFNAVQSILQAPPRGILRYYAPPDSTAVAAGVIVTCPPLTSPGSGPADEDADALDRISAVGLEQLLKDTVVGARMWDTFGFPDIVAGRDIANIAFTLAALYGHPAITVSSGNFPNTGQLLKLFYAPEMTIFDALTKLTTFVAGGASFWVDGNAALHFQADEEA